MVVVVVVVVTVWRGVYDVGCEELVVCSRLVGELYGYCARSAYRFLRGKGFVFTAS